jgi:hypothetical protein
MRAIDTKLRDIRDDETLKLFDELRQVTGIDPTQYADFTAFDFLQQCVYPNGGGLPPVRIRRECINMADDYSTFLLWKKVGKVGDSLHRLLRGLAPSLDDHSGTSIYMLFNKTLIPTKKKKHHRHFHLK